jgi:peptidyl-tRNA hydrolase, PTH1 family
VKSRLTRLFDKFRPAHRERDEPPAERSEVRWVIAGLGNPGEQYRRSRHNSGFMVVDRLASRAGVELTRRKFNGFYAEMRTGAGDALLVMPQTFYNRSGECVAGMLGYFKVPVERLIVIHDEMDLPMGQIRIKRGGSDAGNRGVRSIAEALGPDFNRVRIGVGHPQGPEDTINYIIKPMNDAEMRSFAPIFDRAADAALVIMRDGLDRAMGTYNQRL